MKYTGRIIGMAIVIGCTLGIRIFAYYKFGYSLLHPPIIAVISLYIAYKLGYRYDYYLFMATRDILTRVHNRHYVVENFDKILNKSLRANKIIGVFIIDCNNFKYVNDTYGHVEGDKRLKILADILINNKEHRDIISRWGGDEFLVIKPISSDEGCKKRIKSFNNRLKLISKELESELTVSIGYCMCFEKITLDEAVARADKMMYEQKALRKLNMMDYAAYI